MQINQLRALVPLVLAGSAAATVSCSTKEINLIQNPSFEAGLDNWTVYRGPIDALRGPDSADDDYYLENTGANPNKVGQTVSGLVVGHHYTVSAEWRFKPSTWRGHCAVVIITGSGPVALKEVEVSEAGSDWMTVSGTFSASASNQDVYIVQECDLGGEAVVMDLDNVRILTSTIACSTVTPSTPSKASPSTPLVVSNPVSLIPVPRPSASSHAHVSSSSRLVTVTSRPHRPRPSSTISRRPIKPSGSVSAGSSGIPTITSTIGPQPSGSPGNGGSGNGSGSGNDNGAGSGSGNDSGSGSGNDNGSGSGSGNYSGSGSELTTSTVFTTRTSTITACPKTVTDCPARSTYVTTETVLVSTIVCPVEATTTGAGGPVITGSPSPSNGGQGPQYTTETILTTRTVTACPSSVTNCPARQKTTSVTTETLVASTSVYEVTPTATPAPAQTAGAGARPSSGSGSGSGSEGSNGTTAPQVTAPAALSSAQIPVVTIPVTKMVTVYACPAENKSPF